MPDAQLQTKIETFMADKPKHTHLMATEKDREIPFSGVLGKVYVRTKFLAKPLEGLRHKILRGRAISTAAVTFGQFVISHISEIFTWESFTKVVKVMLTNVAPV